eukprot:1982633-Amphidinium_carterae.2
MKNSRRHTTQASSYAGKVQQTARLAQAVNPLFHGSTSRKSTTYQICRRRPFPTLSSVCYSFLDI